MKDNWSREGAGLGFGMGFVWGGGGVGSMTPVNAAASIDNSSTNPCV